MTGDAGAHDATRGLAGHPIISSDAESVTCACGWVGSRVDHGNHRGVALARQALEAKEAT